MILTVILAKWYNLADKFVTISAGVQKAKTVQFRAEMDLYHCKIFVKGCKKRRL